jgi:hypothetical protein
MPLSECARPHRPDAVDESGGVAHDGIMLEDHRTTNDPLDPKRAPPDEPPDAAEIWGKRIGRGLGFLFALFLIWQLLTTYVFK